MHTSEGLSLGEIQAFVEGSGEVQFKGRNREEVYGWVNRTLRQQHYEDLNRSGRGRVRRYAQKMYWQGEEVKPHVYRRQRFQQRYTGKDIALLADVDDAHGTLSGPGDTETFPAGLLQLQQPAIPEFGGDLSGAVVSTAIESRVSRAAHPVSGEATDGGVDRRGEKAGAAGVPRIPAPSTP